MCYYLRILVMYGNLCEERNYLRFGGEKLVDEVGGSISFACIFRIIKYYKEVGIYRNLAIF